eukprot:gene14032-15491_t
MDNLKIARSLYKISVDVVAENINLFEENIKQFPVQQICDIYQQINDCYEKADLVKQLSDFKHFQRILNASVHDWRVLFKCVQSVLTIKPDFGLQLATKSIKNLCSSEGESLVKQIQNCIILGIFFTECGMFESAGIALSCVKICEATKNREMLQIAVELWTRLTHVYTSDCKFIEAKKALSSAHHILYCFASNNRHLSVHKAMFFTAQSLHFFALSRYAEAHKSSLTALAELSPDFPYKVVVDTLRQAAKTSIVKRQFKQAGTLIKQAVYIARRIAGEEHPKFAECLSDYAFYLLNVDGVASSVEVYKEALDIRKRLFGDNNLLTASSHEDIAYALYVRDYSSGSFTKARENAEIAINTFTNILPRDHLLLASSKRVKALILEEVAIDSDDVTKRDELLQESECLHLESLQLARNAFGESNVQTAKHYGNLGRLYQSMKRYQEAEQMHLRAIEIKQSLLGNEDYEVALSLGHLASLYNYDMAAYQKAEELYHRSIRIGRNLFGNAYSGLEYDYRGLVSLYASTGNYTEMARYHLVLSDWQELRKNTTAPSVANELNYNESLDITDLIKYCQNSILDKEITR